LLCEPLETTANGKRLVVEDSAACQKTIQSPVAQQVLKTDGSNNLTWTNGDNSTVLGKDSTGKVEFATLNSVLQAGPVNLGSQPLTTTGSVSTGSVTATSLASTGSVTATSAVINASSSSNAVRITQTGSGNSLVVEDSTNPDSTPFIIDSEGRVLSGTTSSYPTIYGNIPSVQLVSQFQVSPLAIGRYGTNVYGADIDFTKTRGTIAQNHIIIQNGDQLGNLVWAGSNGVSYIPASTISVLVDGIPSATSMPGRIVLSTTPTGSIIPQERIRIDNAGNTGIGTATPAKTLHVNGTVRLQGLPTYANNAAAITGGLVVNDLFIANVAGEGQLRIVI
jgi:hypothetical protein